MASETEYEKLLTPAEVGVIFRCDPKTVTRWARAGMLSEYRTPGGHRRFKESEVRALLADSHRGRVTDPLDAPVLALWPSRAAGVAAATGRKLRDEGITTVRMLTAQTANDLKNLGFRPAQVDEVRLALARKDLALRGDVLDSKAA